MMHDEEVIDGLLDKIEQLKAERDAAVRELELVTAERNRAHHACEQISVRLHAAMAERDALLAELKNIGDLEKRHVIARESGLSEWADWAQNRARHAAIDAARGDK
jgi:seryl-tRNA synthetase